MNNLDLRKIIKTELKKITARVFYKDSSATMEYPYVTYRLNRSKDEYLDLILLTIDIWDKSTDTTRIELMAESIEKALDHTTINTTENMPTFYFENVLDVEDEDKSIERRQLKFSIRNYSKEGM